MFGTATSQNATNELRAAGVQVAANTTRLLADLAEGRIPPGSLIVADEGSMISITHLAAIVDYAARNGCKLVLAGDQEQLAAVEGGGAMTLLADRLGYVQLAEPVRFTAAWERGASLRLRQGDATALDEYDQHGRIRGAPPDQAMDQAVRAYVASYLDGRDVLLMAADWARCRELSARIRDDLIHLGLVDNGRTIRIADGAQASVGDLIICRRNDHAIEAGEPGRALANGDVLRIEAITPGGIMVRRRLDPDRATGQRRFTDRAFCYAGYQSADLAYAITGHSAQGATVHTGIALVTGTEDRQWLYPAMTRGTDTNLAFVFTTPARPADPQPGTRAAPELDRYDRIRHEHDGYPPGPAAHRQPGQPGPARAGRRARRRPGPRRRRAVRLRRPAAQPGQRRPPGHPARDLDRRNHRPPATTATATWCWPRSRPATGRTCPRRARWLFRTLRAAELAGLDPAEVLRTAIASRDLAGARDIAAVLDARIRPRVDPLLPQPQGPWASRVPRLPDPARQAYLAEIAAMMDDRTQRLGQHAAQTGPAWAITALGPVPADPAARQAWQTKAASIAAYREIYGYDHPDDPIGPEPSHQHTRPAGRLAPGLRRPRPGRRPRRPRHARRPAVAAPRHLRRPDRLGTPPRRKGTAARPARRLRRRPGRHPRRRRSPGRPQGRRPRPRRTARDPGRQLPGPARPLPAARTHPRPGHGRPAGLGARHRRFPAPGHRRRRRTTPPPPRPEDRAAALRRTSPRQRHRTRRQAHPRRPPGSATLPHSTMHSAREPASGSAG